MRHKESTVPFDCLPRQALRRAFDKLGTNGNLIEQESFRHPMPPPGGSEHRSLFAVKGTTRHAADCPRNTSPENRARPTLWHCARRQ